MSREMRLSVLLAHEQNMGDHAEVRHIAFAVDPEESVGELVQRIADATGGFTPVGQQKRLLRGDVIEIRMVESPEVPT